MAQRKKNKKRKKFFTVEAANAMLPLVRVIVRDLAELAGKIRDRQERLARLSRSREATPNAHDEEVLSAVSRYEEEARLDIEKLQELVAELQALGVELKDPLTGLIDFPCWMEEREVFLCWRMDEPEVSHWHELESGFSGRQKLHVAAAHDR